MRIKSFSKMSKVLAIVLLLGFSIISPASAASNPLVYLGFEDVSPLYQSEEDLKFLSSSNNKTFTIERQPAYPDYQIAWFSPSISKKGSRGLGVRLTEPPEKIKQRVELEFAGKSLGNAPLMEQSRYYGFSMYIHPQSPDIQKDTSVFMQVWQNHDTTASKQPPFALRFVENSNYKWRVEVSRDDITDPQVIFTSASGLQKGIWHDFVIWFKPSVESAGAVRVWHNGVQQVSQTNQRNFGYEPRSSQPSVSNYFAARIGAYRTYVPGDDSEIITVFDEVKYGSSLEQINPAL